MGATLWSSFIVKRLKGEPKSEEEEEHDLFYDQRRVASKKRRKFNDLFHGGGGSLKLLIREGASHANMVQLQQALKMKNMI